MKNPFVKDIPSEERTLYSLEHPKSFISESFRMLRTNLMYTNIDRKIRSILFTSANPGEGKSTVISNLAVAMAQAGKRILLIDCDLRKSMLHEVFGISNENGLTKYLTGYCTLEEAIHSTALPNLFVLPSGPIPPNPSELLGSKSMDKLIEMVQEEYDHVLIDSPPVMSVADPIILAGKNDGVILVVRSGYAKINGVKESYEQLKKAEANIIGTVLNSAAQDKSRYYRGYNRYYRNSKENYYEE